ncbi:MAG TPA: hypothetical protein VHA37_08460 [Candidatus Saccharimonadales bacterium]|nr:hypothetical protein [Candidatus Saccharimonadales bacterium]
MSDDQLAKLFPYLQEGFTAVRHGIAETKLLVSSCVNAVDAFAKRTETYHHEMLALGHKVDCHEHWIHELSGGTGTELSSA